MKKVLTLILFFHLAASTFAAPTVSPPALIPLPAHLATRPGFFRLAPSCKIVADPFGRETASALAAHLRRSTGYFCPVETSGRGRHGDIILTTNGTAGFAPEGYELEVSPNRVLIRAASAAGLFYGGQTLLQLFPAQILSDHEIKKQAWTAPCVQIKDQPAFVWRGLMLDVSRHFFTLPEVEKVIDSMSLYKLNMLHLHLVDDQGWRIEIKKYPRLTEVAGWRKGIDYGLDPKSSTAYRADGKYGGFYTQDDIREMVRYAAARHVTIVPEIEMPGHSAGALAPYPQFSCSGGPFDNDGDDAIFCVGNEGTFTFLQNVLSEVFELFPGEFVHIGGDEVSTRNWRECPKCQARMRAEGLQNERQLESYLIQRMERFINAHGKRLIGWSEIRDGGLAQNAAIMDWIGGGNEAAKSGHDVVMSPTAFCYLDHYQSHNHLAEQKAIGGFLSLQKVYQFNPVPADLNPSQRKHILGGQGNLWTEYVPNIDRVEYMIYPRECAMAEVLWTPATARFWPDFLERVKQNEPRLQAMGIHYRPKPASVGL